jgi:hypothetical protein
MGLVQDILFEECEPPSLPLAVFVEFEAYKEPTITSLKGNKVVPIVPIKRN